MYMFQSKRVLLRGFVSDFADLHRNCKVFESLTGRMVKGTRGVMGWTPDHGARGTHARDMSMMYPGIGRFRGGCGADAPRSMGRDARPMVRGPGQGEGVPPKTRATPRETCPRLSSPHSFFSSGAPR